MSLWTDRVRNSPVWQQLQQLGPVIDQALGREDVDAGTIDGLERLRAVLTFIGKRLAGLDPALLLQAPLDGIAGSLQSATSEVQNYIANGNSGHVVTANAHTDSALTNLAGLVGLDAPSELEALGTAALNYRSTLEGAIQKAHSASTQFGTDLDALRAKLNELAAEMASERQRLSALVTEFQAQFSTAQEGRSTEYLAAQAARQDKFAALVEEHTARLNQQDVGSAKSRDAALKDFQTNLEDLTSDYRAKAEAILGEVDANRKQVEKLVGVIGNLGVTSGYLTTANRAQVSLWIWQAITVGALGGLIFVAYKAFLPVVAGNFSWPGFASRVFLSLTVGVLAMYAASQADKFLNIERHNRKLALELEALGPFLAPLAPDKQETFRLAVGDKSFGGNDTSGSHSDRSPATVFDMLLKSKDFRSFITELVRAARSG